MKPLDLLKKYHKGATLADSVVLIHSVLVTKKALDIAFELKNSPAKIESGEQVGLWRKKEIAKLDFNFIYSAGILHDIGVDFPDYVERAGDTKGGIETDNSAADKIISAPAEIKELYLAHGFWGAEILRSEDRPREAEVAENHIGLGVTQKDIQENNWPLPEKDYFPQTPESLIISYADLFFSKSMKDHALGVANIFREESKETVMDEIKGFAGGEEKLKIFLKWDKVLGGV